MEKGRNVCVLHRCASKLCHAVRKISKINLRLFGKIIIFSSEWYVSQNSIQLDKPSR